MLIVVMGHTLVVNSEMRFRDISGWKKIDFDYNLPKFTFLIQTTYFYLNMLYDQI